MDSSILAQYKNDSKHHQSNAGVSTTCNDTWFEIDIS